MHQNPTVAENKSHVHLNHKTFYLGTTDQTQLGGDYICAHGLLHYLVTFDNVYKHI